MEEAKASWNTVYQSKEGFECQITLRDEDETSVAERAKKTMASLTKTGAEPIKRFKSMPNSYSKISSEKEKNNTNSKKQEKAYFDEEGVWRCNRKLNNGAVGFIIGFKISLNRNIASSFSFVPTAGCFHQKFMPDLLQFFSVVSAENFNPVNLQIGNQRGKFAFVLIC